MIEVRISDYMQLDSLAVWVFMKIDATTRRMLHIDDAGRQVWTDVQIDAAAVQAEPTLLLPHEAAHALLEELTRYYQGAADMRTVRSDLLHERGRVDTLTGALIRLVDRKGNEGRQP